LLGTCDLSKPLEHSLTYQKENKTVKDSVIYLCPTDSRLKCFPGHGHNKLLSRQTMLRHDCDRTLIGCWIKSHVHWAEERRKLGRRPEIVRLPSSVVHVHRKTGYVYRTPASSSRASLSPRSYDLAPPSQWCVRESNRVIFLLTNAGPPHNNTGRLLRRTHHRPRRLRILPSSRCLAEVRRRQRWKWRW
jgi:hypothetical protein